LKIRRDIFRRQIAVVTDETILFRRIEVHQKLFAAGLMRNVAAFASRRRNSIVHAAGNFFDAAFRRSDCCRLGQIRSDFCRQNFYRQCVR